jgi:2-polyprenyl-3-methyl-5-hydroxy-6-metoxy-1,4-benzoquinol methylase
MLEVQDPDPQLTPDAPSGKDPGPTARRKARGGAIAKALLGRVVNPKHVTRAIKLHWTRRSHRHTFDDAQLALYARILPSDFLHFGYFDDPQRQPEDISLAEVSRAQNRYAELLLEQAGNPADPVLDVGCGMGGLCRMLAARGYSPVALTPDRLQVTHITATLPEVPVIRTKLEELKVEEHAGKYGTIITAESLQYLKLPKALPVLSAVLKPGGRWVACDYFHSQPSADRACHFWDDFPIELAGAGWRISYQRDITAHVLPMLAYIHMWATRFGIPLMQFAFLRLRRKQPAIHHMLGGVLDLLEEMASSNIELIDPVHFAATTKYMLLVMERA